MLQGDCVFLQFSGSLRAQKGNLFFQLFNKTSPFKIPGENSYWEAPPAGARGPCPEIVF